MVSAEFPWMADEKWLCSLHISMGDWNYMKSLNSLPLFIFWKHIYHQPTNKKSVSYFDWRSPSLTSDTFSNCVCVCPSNEPGWKDHTNPYRLRSLRRAGNQEEIVPTSWLLWRIRVLYSLRAHVDHECQSKSMGKLCALGAVYQITLDFLRRFTFSQRSFTFKC